MLRRSDAVIMNVRNFEPNKVDLLGHHDLPPGFLDPGRPPTSLLRLTAGSYLDEQQRCGFCFRLGEGHSYRSALSFQDDC